MSFSGVNRSGQRKGAGRIDDLGELGDEVPEEAAGESAENKGHDEHDGGDHPRHEDAGGADGDDLIEQDFRAKEHEARLDVVFNLKRRLYPTAGYRSCWR